MSSPSVSVRPPILTRPMMLLMAAVIVSMTSFYLLLSVVPWYVVRNGAGQAAAGLSTGAMMLATVLVEVVVPRLLARFGYRTMLAAGLVLLGVPSVLLTVSATLPLVLIVCLIRGAGLGIVVVAGTGLVAELAPAERRSESLGLYGVAVGMPAIIGLPVGLWAADRVGFDAVFLAGAVLSLLAAAALPGLPPAAGRIESPGANPGAPAAPGSPERHTTTSDTRTAPASAERHATISATPAGPESADPHAAASCPGTVPRAGGGVLGALRVSGIARPTLVFAAITLAAGVFVTFLPVAVSGGSRQVAALALLALSCTAPLARWGTGRFTDRRGTGGLLVPAVLATAVGTMGLCLPDRPFAVVAGMAVFGLGFGVAQNVTLVLMLDRVPRAEFGRVSALWNLSYDAGMGAGAVGFGLVAAPIGYRAGFALTAALLFLALAPAWRDSRKDTYE